MIFNKIDYNAAEKVLLKRYLYGFRTFDETFFNSEDYLKLKDITKINPIKYTGKIKFYSTFDFLKFGKDFILTEADGIDTSVRCDENYKLSTYLTKKYGRSINKTLYNSVIRDIDENVDKREIYDVPVEYNPYCTSEKSNIEVSYMYPYLDYSFYKNLDPIFRKININGLNTSLAPFIYIHEMYHGLVQRNKDAIIDLSHEEFIPIFMEKVAAYKTGEDEEVREEIFRINDVRNNILDLENNINENNINYKTLSHEIYIISTLLATSLYSKYKNSNENIKNEIIDYINRVVSGRMAVEDLLDMFDISEKDGAREINNKSKTYEIIRKRRMNYDE